MDIRLKRAYETPADNDGCRILVDGLWPRGVSKQELKIDLWLKILAPSKALREWFGHKDDRWPEFRRRYWRQLHAQHRATALESLQEKVHQGRVTLVYAASNTEYNNAVVLKEYLEK